MLIFVPLSFTELAALATTGPRDVAGYAATPAFLASFGMTDAEAEETDLTLLEIAALASLLAHGARLVAVCEAGGDLSEPADLGAVRAHGVGWDRVRSLFTDDEAGAAAATQALASLTTRNVGEAWDHPAVTTLIEGSDLLWHGSGEWDRLTH